MFSPASTVRTCILQLPRDAQPCFNRQSAISLLRASKTRQESTLHSVSKNALVSGGKDLGETLLKSS